MSLSRPASIEPIHPVVALLLSALFPGLGHLYIGRAARWGICVGVVLGIYFALGLAGALSSFWGYATVLLLFSCVYVFLLFDAFRLARTAPPAERRWYSRWYVYGLFILALVAYAVFVPEVGPVFLGYATFRVPGESMSPTLLRGDYILVDTHAYRTSPPRTGDVVIVSSPAAGVKYIRRIAPGSEGQAFAVLSDNPAAGEDSRKWGPLSASNILGRVTSIYFSPNVQRIGREVK
jgi:nickel-type superoxide dismutase maturation protease